MSVNILTKQGEEITHIDDARAYNFDAGNRSGILKGAFNEGKFFAVSSNVIGLDSCELRIAGHRIIIDSAESITLSNMPTTNTRYSMIAEIVVSDTSVPTFRLFIQPSTTPLTQNNLYKTLKGNGTYQLEIGRFTLTTNGLIEDVVRTADIITGGTNGSDTNYIKIGKVTTTTISQGSQANVDIENVLDEQTGKEKTNFNFEIPATSGTTVSVNGIEQKELSFKSDPQTQLNQISNPNLLINGDFRVNQRGQTSYTGNSTGIYSYDRWFLKNSCQLYLNETTGKARYKSLYQYVAMWQNVEVDNSNTFSGKTLTASLKISNSTLSGIFFNFLYTTETNSSWTELVGKRIDTDFTTITGTLPNEKITGLRVRIFEAGTNLSEFDIDYIKLEIGSVATAFSPRPYAEELAMCQRYYQFLNNPNCIGRTNYSDDTSGLLFVPIPVTMRPKYSITTSANPVCYGSGKSTTASGITFSAQRENGFKMNITLPTGLGIRQVLQAEGVVYTIDAEIY